MKEIYPGTEGLKTVGDHTVRIYAIERTIHGAVYHDNEWRFEVWEKKNGHAIFKRSQFDLDLIDWRDEIPWDHLQDWVQWVARNEYDEWRAYENKPCIAERKHWISSSNWRQCCLGAVRMPAGPDDWRQTITKRPEK